MSAAQARTMRQLSHRTRVSASKVLSFQFRISRSRVSAWILFSSITKTSIHLSHPSPLRKNFCAFGVYFLRRFRCVIGVGTGKDYVDKVGNRAAMLRIFFEVQGLCQGD